MPVLSPTKWNPNDKGEAVTLNPNGVDATSNNYSNGAVRTIHRASSGKYYVEFKGSNNYVTVGVATEDAPMVGSSVYPGSTAKSWSIYFVNGSKYHKDIASPYFPRGILATDVLGIALDMDAKTISGYLNGVSPGVMYSDLPSTLLFSFGSGASAVVNIHANFGQEPFAYPVPPLHYAGFGELVPVNRVAGVVLDDAGNPAVRKVHVHRRSTGEVMGSGLSDVMGAFDIVVPNFDAVYAVALDDDVGEKYNALIFDRVLPIPEE